MMQTFYALCHDDLALSYFRNTSRLILTIPYPNDFVVKDVDFYYYIRFFNCENTHTLGSNIRGLSQKYVDICD